MIEPVINYHFTIEQAARRRGWHRTNNYRLWVELTPQEQSSHRLVVRRGGEQVVVPDAVRQMHFLPAGTTYRVEHLFAPWHRSDADAIYLRLAEPEGIYTALITATGKTVGNSALVWICPACDAEIASEHFDVRTHDLADFWPFQLNQVRSFNAGARICTSCAKVHPVAYGIDRQSDTPPEAAAREEW